MTFLKNNIIPIVLFAIIIGLTAAYVIERRARIKAENKPAIERIKTITIQQEAIAKSKDSLTDDIRKAGQTAVANSKLKTIPNEKHIISDVSADSAYSYLTSKAVHVQR